MDARLREGIALFNAQKFFECHEVLETFYQETEVAQKPFLEGLVQLAAAFRMFVDFGEVKGPVRMVRQALIRFEEYQPNFLQVKVKELSESLNLWAQAVEKGGAAEIPKIALQRFSFFS
ncbi:MAG: DUF309 domain-containing protein [Deltaproteobacteria bacterium]|nr:DUF309 domain-containing protein [Deltaproteobacteria bacterium]